MGNTDDVPPDRGVVSAYEDPYADVDVSDLPDWWREAIEEFRDHDLRPYRPPRFSDGQLTHDVVERLEAEFDVAIDFIGLNVTHGDDWAVRVDGDRVGEIGRRRTAEAYTELTMAGDQFADWIVDQL